MSATRSVKVKIEGDASALQKTIGELRDQIDGLHDVQRLRLEPGDVLVLRTADRLDQAELEATLDELKSMFPDNRACVLMQGDEFEVVSPPEVSTVLYGPVPNGSTISVSSS